MGSITAGSVLSGARVVVTGATGFLGSHLVRRLVSEGADVHILVRGSSSFGRLRGLEPVLTRWEGDVTNFVSIEQCFRGASPTTVFHLAGNTVSRRRVGDWAAIQQAIDVNLLGTLNVVHAAATSGAPVVSVIRLGGLEEYGTGQTPYLEAQREQPSSPYSASQVAATHVCQALQGHLSFGVITLRPALVYGPGQSSDFLIPALIGALLRGDRFAMSDGTQWRDLLYVDDFVDAAVRAAGRPDLRGTILNISSGTEWQVRDVARQIVAIMGAGALLDVAAHPARPGELMHLVASNRSAAELLEWRPVVGLADGLARTVDAYRAAAAAPRHESQGMELD